MGREPEEMSFEQFDCVPAPVLPTKLPWAELAMSSGACVRVGVGVCVCVFEWERDGALLTVHDTTRT